LTIDGTMTPGSFTGITSQASLGSTGNAGTVSVSAGSLSIDNSGAISSSTLGPGSSGSVLVSVAGGLTIDGTMTPGSFTGITSQASRGSTGNAGTVSVNAGSLSIDNSGEISSGTFGPGTSGSVLVNVAGRLTIDGTMTPGSFTGINSQANAGSTGNAGSVTVAAGGLSINSGQISSSTAGRGKGGDVNVIVASDIVLPDAGPKIAARSTGSGDAGSITVSAVRLQMNNGAAISTEAETSTASGGNITLKVSDLVYLVSSEITTSVKGETGSGGNITIDPRLVVLNHSSIIAQAIEGHGGNITINAGAFIASAGSEVSATSQTGISGTVSITSLFNLSGALVVLSSELRGRAAVLREACAAYGDRPISSLVEAGRGGLPQDPEATLPALYIADRDVNPNPQAGIDKAEESIAPLQTTVRLTMHCG
jgi:large exoprotein involved in heme utilization and adhesion